MNFDRRQVLIAMGCTALASPLRAERSQLVLRPGKVTLPVNGQRIEMLGFNGSVPGPEIRMRQGDMLTARLDNTLQEGTMLHWHGIRLPNAMDGVNVLTQDAIIPGGKFDYRFRAPDAGTFWYHSHYLSLEQVSRGLFGPLIVEELDAPDVDQDITIQLFDFLSDATGGFDPEYYTSHYATAGRIGDVMMAFSSSSITRTGERLRLRIINPSVDRIFRVQIEGLDGVIVALDGMPLEQTIPLGELTLAPGQRVDVIGDVKSDVMFFEQSESEPNLLSRIVSTGFQGQRSSEIQSLPENGLPRPGKVNHQIDLVMQGGARAPSHGGFGTWAFNDVSGLPREPIVSARRGDTVLIRLRNETAFPHGIHLHGHHFWETTANGVATTLRDTTVVDPGEERIILCVLDNPGAWLIHCHMLSHQEDGMASWVFVS